LDEAACWIVTATLPVFVNVRFCDIFCPAATFPKFKLVGEMAKLGVATCCCLPPTIPAQPFSRSTGTSASATKRTLFQPLPCRNSPLALRLTAPT
jgi:hypothetical protein